VFSTLIPSFLLSFLLITAVCRSALVKTRQLSGSIDRYYIPALTPLLCYCMLCATLSSAPLCYALQCFYRFICGVFFVLQSYTLSSSSHQLSSCSHRRLLNVKELLEREGTFNIYHLQINTRPHCPHLTMVSFTLFQILKVISRPIHVGALISNICEGQYSSVHQAVADITLVADNCR
jgi:Bromodomain